MIILVQIWATFLWIMCLSKVYLIIPIKCRYLFLEMQSWQMYYVNYCWYFFLEDHSNVPVGVPESNNWCGYSTSSYSPNAVPIGGGYAAYPDATVGSSTTTVMDAPSASKFYIHYYLFEYGVHIMNSNII